MMDFGNTNFFGNTSFTGTPGSLDLGLGGQNLWSNPDGTAAPAPGTGPDPDPTTAASTTSTDVDKAARKKVLGDIFDFRHMDLADAMLFVALYALSQSETDVDTIVDEVEQIRKEAEASGDICAAFKKLVAALGSTTTGNIAKVLDANPGLMESINGKLSEMGYLDNANFVPPPRPDGLEDFTSEDRSLLNRSVLGRAYLAAWDAGTADNFFDRKPLSEYSDLQNAVFGVKGASPALVAKIDAWHERSIQVIAARNEIAFNGVGLTRDTKVGDVLEFLQKEQNRQQDLQTQASQKGAEMQRATSKNNVFQQISTSVLQVLKDASRSILGNTSSR